MQNDECRIGLTGLVISLDGKTSVKVTGEGADAEKLGRGLAQNAIAQGANEILSLVTAH
jgi:porphobilinogen deaminase